MAYSLVQPRGYILILAGNKLLPPSIQVWNIFKYEILLVDNELLPLQIKYKM